MELDAKPRRVVLTFPGPMAGVTKSMVRRVKTMLILRAVLFAEYWAAVVVVEVELELKNYLLYY